MNEIKSEIGECVIALISNDFSNINLSREQCKRTLKRLLDDSTDIYPEAQLNPGIYNEDGLLQENPLAFEDEMKLDKTLSKYWLEWLQKTMK
jgi:hypothetical protein